MIYAKALSKYLVNSNKQRNDSGSLLLKAARPFRLVGSLVTDFLPLVVWTHRTWVRKMPCLTRPCGQSRQSASSRQCNICLHGYFFYRLDLFFLESWQRFFKWNFCQKIFRVFFLMCNPPPKNVHAKMTPQFL